MIFDLMRNGFSVDILISLMARVFVVFCVLPIHEFAHALVATKLGDDTPRLKGRLTLAPLAHIDIMGALMIFLVGFGYAKSVPVNPRKFKNLKSGMAITALAGPLSNLIMAIFFMILANGCSLIYSSTASVVAQVSIIFFSVAAQLNVSLAVFNLLPIPPLDGSIIAKLFVPQKYYFKIMQYERYIVLGVFALIVFGILDKPLSLLSGFVMTGINFIARLPFLPFI